ncbi:MAG: PilZ domain-containing protein [Deltaproteobacteria bacterium]|nr:PilZ domain-containing protein [Deltaproteobacteria bacterium]
MSADRRSDRIRVSIPATVRAGSRAYRDVVTDLSLTGLFLQAATERPRIGERIRVSFSLPVGDERAIPLDVDGEIARVVKNMANRTKGLGVRFIRPKPAVTEAIQAYLGSDDGTLARPSGLGRWTGSGPAADEREVTDPAEPRSAPPARTYDFSAEAPDLDDDAEMDTDPRYPLPSDGDA